MNNLPLWKPSTQKISDSQMFNFMEYVNETFDLSLSDYQELHKWSVDENLHFWESCLNYFDIIHSSPYTKIVDIKNVMVSSGSGGRDETRSKLKATCRIAGRQRSEP